MGSREGGWNGAWMAKMAFIGGGLSAAGYMTVKVPWLWSAAAVVVLLVKWAVILGVLGVGGVVLVKWLGSGEDENWSLADIKVMLENMWSGEDYTFTSFEENSGKNPKAWPIMGCQREATKNFYRLHDWCHSFFSDDHRTVSLKFFSTKVYLTVDPANVEHILQTNFANYPKGEKTREKMQDMLGDGIFNADGEQWRSQRIITTTVFAGRTLKAFSLKCFREDSLRRLYILNEAAETQETIDLQKLLMSMTMESISRVGFGIHNTPGSESSTTASTDATTQSSSSSSDGSVLTSISVFSNAFDKANANISRRYVNVFWKLHRFLRWGTERVLQQELCKINSFANQLISQRREEMQAAKEEAEKVAQDEGSNKEASASASATASNSAAVAATGPPAQEEKDDLLSRLIQIEAYSSKGTGLRDAILNIVLAGRDTTAVTMSWCIYNVCQKQEVEEKIINEIKKVIGFNKYRDADTWTFEDVADRLTFEALCKMNYLHATLTETLRLYPAVPRDTKYAVKDDVLPDGTRVKAGEYVAFVPYSMGRMRFLWGDDVLEFKPERWLKNGIFRPVSPFKFTVFQGGARTCLGIDWAYLQMKMAMALFFYFFEFRIVSTDVRYRMMMVLAMANGLEVTVHPRRISRLQACKSIKYG